MKNMILLYLVKLMYIRVNKKYLANFIYYTILNFIRTID